MSTKGPVRPSKLSSQKSAETPKRKSEKDEKETKPSKTIPIDKNTPSSNKNRGNVSDRSLLKPTVSQSPTPRTKLKTTTTFTKPVTKQSSSGSGSSRVTTTKYFPKKIDYGSLLKEYSKNEKPEKVKSPKEVQRVNEKTKAKKVEKPSPRVNKVEEETKKVRQFVEGRVSEMKSKHVKENKGEALLKSSKEKEASSGDKVEDPNRPKLIRERTLTRILSPSEVKLLKRLSSNSVTDSEQASGAAADDDYEDDFDSYESDFEEYESDSSGSTSPAPSNLSTSTSSSSEDITKKNDEEKKMDSGNYDLPDVKHTQVLDEIKEDENFDEKNNPASFSDEGFEEGAKSEMTFINFSSIKRRESKMSRKLKKRGEDILGMIRLDSVNLTLLNIPPISYEVFMKSYGGRNSTQCSTQTGEDDVDEEIQTDEIVYFDGFTQLPVEDDVKPIQTNKEHVIDESEAVNEIYKNELVKNSFDVPFSKGYIALNTNITFLSERPIDFVHYAFEKQSSLLSVHRSTTMPIHEEHQLSKCLICVWNVFEPQSPQKFLVSSGDVKVCCFDRNGWFVFAGLYNGSINMWDLREPPSYHSSVYDKITEKNYILRSCSYTSGVSIEGKGHRAEVVAVQVMSESDEDSLSYLQNISLEKICSLDETGIIIIWNIIQKENLSADLVQDHRISNWSRVFLIQKVQIDLRDCYSDTKQLRCFDLVCNGNHLYVATNYGSLLHCMESGAKPVPKKFISCDASPVLCAEMCSFSPKYFLVGSQNGSVRLYATHLERSRKTFLNTGGECDEIQCIRWSTCRPCVFYTHSWKNVYVWDLTFSDMFPKYSISFDKKINSIAVSPFKDEFKRSFMSIAFDDGEIQVHELNEEHFSRGVEKRDLERKQFLNYASRL